MHRFLLLALLLAAANAPAVAQDERRVTSPDGRLEFRILLSQPEPGALFRLAYQISLDGKRVIDTSFLGLNIRFQEPLLGENVGLTKASSGKTGGYNSLTLEYMQNGSLGRRINVEVRAANDGIAFRYLIPKTSPVENLLLEDETTEFALARDGAANLPNRIGSTRLAQIDTKSRMSLPFIAQQPGVGWVVINEVRAGDYPRASLVRSEGTVFLTRLQSTEGDPAVVFESATPLTCPWRVVMVGPDRDRLLLSESFKDLDR